MTASVAAERELPHVEPVAAPAMATARDWDAIAVRLGWVTLAIVVALGLIAPIRRTGDAHQYYAMAGALAERRPPALTPPQVASFKAWLSAQPPDSGFPGALGVVEQPVLVRGDHQEFSHFWLFPLLAAPFVAAAGWLGVHPGYGFLALNALLLAAALLAVQRAGRPVVGLLLLASPVVWFVDKAQVELFTFACLTLAMAAAMRGRFAWAALTVAIASTQNLPIVAAVPCFWAAGLVRWRVLSAAAPSPTPPPTAREGLSTCRRHHQDRPRLATRAGMAAAVSPSLAVGGGVGKGAKIVGLVILTLVIGALHPVYYLWRLGVVTPQQLNGGIRGGWPEPGRYLAVLIDPDIGLLAWAPLVGVVGLVGLVALIGSGRSGAPWATLDLRLAAGCALLCGAWFLFVFAKTTNVNSGGTVHMSRYAMWLMPLLLPFLAAAAGWLGARRAALLPVAAAGAFVCYAVAFRPGLPEQYIRPSPQSEAINTWLPGLYLPIPEVFYERQRGVDGGARGSAANRGCTVILLDADAPEQPCPLSSPERARADRLYADGWRAVWITRPGRLGLGGGGIAGAIRRT